MSKRPSSAFKMKDDDYTRRKQFMDSNISHHGHCVPSELRKRPKSPPKKEIKPNFDNVEEKLLVLKDDNHHLKVKKKELEEDVKLIAAKLKRQINQLKKDRILGAGGQLYAKIDLDLDKLIDDNLRLQDEEHKLTLQVKKMQKKRQLGITENQKKLRKTVDYMGGGNKSRSRSPNKRADRFGGDLVQELQSYRLHIEKSQKTIQEMKSEIEFSKRATHGQIASEDLVQELRKKELQVAQQKAKLEDLQDNLGVKSDIFQSNESYQNGLLAELKQLKTQQLNLQSENRALEEAEKTAEYVNKELADVTIERNRLQSEYSLITKQPFFKREMDQDHFQKIKVLQTKIDEKEKIVKDAKANILNMDQTMNKLQEENRNIRMERDTYQEEIERLRLQMDPSNLSLAEIQRRIHDLDPSMFRQVMKDLHYDGEEPIWAKFEFLEKMKLGPNNQPLDETDPFALRKEIERLKMERRDLAAELDRVQAQLKILVSADKENQHYQTQEINMLKNRIIGNNTKINDLNQLIKARNTKLLTIAKQSGLQKSGLTAEGLAELDRELDKLRKEQRDDEVMTEFSVVTDESEIAPQENVLDLVINTGELNKNKLSQLLGHKELLPGAVQTFVTVDFYNHETRTTELAEGFEPNYSTQFSFKNNVDDFYVGFIEKNYIIVEFFLSRAQNALKIGSAKLLLSTLLEKDSTFQAQEIMHEGGEMGSTYSLGKIFYKMRMRRPIDEAVKWYQQRTALKKQRDPNTIINEYHPHNYENGGFLKKRSKAITIQVAKCYDLKRPDNSYSSKQMQPFYYFSFFTFEYTSPILDGQNPQFDIKKTFEIEINEQFMEYMRTQLLKIDFIDDSVDMTQPNAKDYIGSVRIPLRELMLNEHLEDNFPIYDDNRVETGRVEVKMVCKDFTPYPYELNEADLTGQMKMSKYAEREIIQRIAMKFAESMSIDIEIIFDMLLENGENYKISKQRFKDYLLHTMNVREQDIDILLKTNIHIQGKDHIDKNDFKNMFEQAIAEARQSIFDEQNDRIKKYQAAQSYLQTHNAGGKNLTTTNVKNPFLNDTINDRVNITPGFDISKKHTGAIGMDTFNEKDQPFDRSNTQLSNVSGKARIEEEKKRQNIMEVIKTQAYHMMNKFAEVIKPPGTPYADFEQFRQVFETYTLNQDDIANVWGQFSMEGKFFYYDTLFQLAQKQQASSSGNPQLLLLNQHRSRHSDVKVMAVKQKLQQYLLQANTGLQELFTFIDKDKSNSLSIGELTTKMKGILNDDESLALFQAVDQDQSNEITRDELISECSKIHCSYVLQKLRNAIETGKMTYEKVFEAVDDDGNNTMEVHEFNQAVNLLFQNVEKYEIDALFKHFDVQGVGRITKEEFKRALTRPMSLEHKLTFILHDFLTPLQSLLKSYKLTPGGLFDRFSRDKKVVNLMDFREIMRQMLRIELSEDEENLLVAAINGIYGPHTNGVLDKNNFINFLTRSFIVKSFAKGDEVVARKSLVKIREMTKVKRGNKTFMELITPFLDELAQQQKNQQPVINIRNLKMFLFITYNLNQYEIENLIDFLDRDNNGFVGAIDIDKQLK
eukprot:403370193